MTAVDLAEAISCSVRLQRSGVDYQEAARIAADSFGISVNCEDAQLALQCGPEYWESPEEIRLSADRICRFEGTGVIHDTHDCSRGGSRCVYGYYRREAE